MKTPKAIERVPLFLSTIAMALALASQSCKTTQNGMNSKLASDEATSQELPADTQRLWDAYVQTLASKKLQPGCDPVHLKPKGAAQGLVVIYHGFSGCPTQFINMGLELAEQGYHVLLPLLPGNGRVPKKIDQERIDRLEKEQGKPIAEISAAGGADNVIEDDYSDIPMNVAEYYQYAENITKLAKSYPGPRIIGGLSLGGGLAVATLIKGADLKGPNELNVWTRSLLMTPFFRAPSIQGNVVPIAGFSAPGFGFGFGANCESGQLLTGFRKRKGFCDFAVGNINTLQTLGGEVGKKEEMSKIKVPVQIIAVANDQTSDNTSIINAFSFTNPADTRLCFYPDEVSHAIFIDSDFASLAPDYAKTLGSVREANATPRFPRFWARSAQDRAIEFISKGFTSGEGPFVLSKEPSTETNKAAKRCELTIDYDAVLLENKKLCESGKGSADFCSDYSAALGNVCSEKAIQAYPASSPLKQYCQKKMAQ